MTDGPVQDWEHLARTIKERREHLGFSQDKVRELDGPSQPVQTQVENNDSTKPRPHVDSLHKYDKPFGWEPGSTLATLRGGNPTPVGARTSIRDIADADLLAEVQRRMSEGREVSNVVQLKTKTQADPTAPGPHEKLVARDEAESKD